EGAVRRRRRWFPADPGCVRPARSGSLLSMILRPWHRRPARYLKPMAGRRSRRPLASTIRHRLVDRASEGSRNTHQDPPYKTLRARPTTPKPIGPRLLRSIQPTRARRLSDASVGPAEARNWQYWAALGLRIGAPGAPDECQRKSLPVVSV